MGLRRDNCKRPAALTSSLVYGYPQGTRADDLESCNSKSRTCILGSPYCRQDFWGGFFQCAEFGLLLSCRRQSCLTSRLETNIAFVGLSVFQFRMPAEFSGHCFRSEPFLSSEAW